MSLERIPQNRKEQSDVQEWVALGRQDQYNVPLLIDRTYTTC